MKLPVALHRNFAVVKLLDVPRLHRNRFQLRLPSILQGDDAVSSLDVQSGQRVTERGVSIFLPLTTHQELDVAGTQEVRRLNWDGLGRGWKQNWAESGLPQSLTLPLEGGGWLTPGNCASLCTESSAAPFLHVQSRNFSLKRAVSLCSEMQPSKAQSGRPSPFLRTEDTAQSEYYDIVVLTNRPLIKCALWQQRKLQRLQSELTAAHWCCSVWGPAGSLDSCCSRRLRPRAGESAAVQCPSCRGRHRVRATGRPRCRNPTPRPQRSPVWRRWGWRPRPPREEPACSPPACTHSWTPPLLAHRARPPLPHWLLRAERMDEKPSQRSSGQENLKIQVSSASTELLASGTAKILQVTFTTFSNNNNKLKQIHARRTSVLSSPSQEPPEVFSQAVITVHPLLQVNHLGGLAAEIPLTLDGPGQLQGLGRAKKESNRVRKHNNKQY